MGQVIIEVPQEVNYTFKIKDAKFAEEILRLIEKPEKQTMHLDSLDDLSDVDENAVLGIWADRQKSPAEIARQLRQSWNRDEG